MKRLMITIVAVALMVSTTCMADSSSIQRRSDRVSPELAFSDKEVYVYSGYFRYPYMAEALDCLEAAGYTLSTNRKAPLQLKISFKSQKTGGYGRLSGRYRINIGLQGRIYTCTAYLEGQHGRILARGQADNSYFTDIRFPIPTGRKSILMTNSVSLRGSTDEAKAKAAINAIAALVQNHRAKAL